jgi:hypothetical protein
MEHITHEWLTANNHDKKWLASWLAKPCIDKEAVREWLTIHRHSDPRLWIDCALVDDEEQGQIRIARQRGKRASQKRARKIREQARKQTPFPCTPSQRLSRFALFNGRCAYCGTHGKMTVDHVVPLSRGGFDEASNIVPACTKCNSSKHARPVLEWYQSQPFFKQSQWDKIVRHCKSKFGRNFGAT